MTVTDSYSTKNSIQVRVYYDDSYISSCTIDAPYLFKRYESYNPAYAWDGGFRLNLKSGYEWVNETFNARFVWSVTGTGLDEDSYGANWFSTNWNSSLSNAQSTALSKCTSYMSSGSTYIDYLKYNRSGSSFTTDSTIRKIVLDMNGASYSTYCATVGICKITLDSSMIRPCTYNLRFDYNGGTGDIVSTQVTTGQKIGIIPSATREGYTASWKIGSTAITADTIWSWGSDQVAVAQWTFNGYTLTTSVSPTGGGSIIDTNTEYAKNSTVKAQAVPESNYIFEYWLLNNERKTVNPLSFTITQDSTLVAYFKAIPTITVAFSGGEGTYSNEKIGDTDYLVLTPSSGMYVNSITVGNTTYPTEYYEGVLYGAGNANRITYYAKEETNIVSMSFEYLYGTTNITVNLANTKQTLKTPSYGSKIEGVAITASSGGEVRVNGFDTEDETSVVHLSAIAFNGYTFMGWFASDGTDLTAYNKLSVDIPYNLVQGKVITAKFQKTNNTNVNEATDSGDHNFLD